MRYFQALLAAVAISTVAAPIVAYADEDEHEEHEGRDWDHRDWGENREERREEWREERRENTPWYGYGGYNYSYPYTYNYNNYYGNGYYYGGQRCRWVTQRYYGAYGDLESHRVWTCW